MLSKVDLRDFLEINNSLYDRDTSERIHSNWYDTLLGIKLFSASLGTTLADTKD